MGRVPSCPGFGYRGNVISENVRDSVAPYRWCCDSSRCSAYLFYVEIKRQSEKINSNTLRFILTHAVYCWLDFFGFGLLSDGVFEPLSWYSLECPIIK